MELCKIGFNVVRLLLTTLCSELPFPTNEKCAVKRTAVRMHITRKSNNNPKTATPLTRHGWMIVGDLSGKSSSNKQWWRHVSDAFAWAGCSCSQQLRNCYYKVAGLIWSIKIVTIEIFKHEYIRNYCRQFKITKSDAIRPHSKREFLFVFHTVRQTRKCSLN